MEIFDQSLSRRGFRRVSSLCVLIVAFDWLLIHSKNGFESELRIEICVGFQTVNSRAYKQNKTHSINYFLL